MIRKEVLDKNNTCFLSPNEFKTYCLLLEKAEKGEIKDFTIRVFLRELQENESNLNMPTGKNTVKSVIRSLIKHNLIDVDSERLKIL